MVLLSKLVELKSGGLVGMVNAIWKPALAVVTREGNIHVFELSERKDSPSEAFKSLAPNMNFNSLNTWVSGRKLEIVRTLTPIVSLDMNRSKIIVSTLRKRQLEIVEERSETEGRSMLRNAMNAAGGQRHKKCIHIHHLSYYTFANSMS